MAAIRRWIPWVVLALGVLYIAGAAYPRKSKAEDFNLVGFGQLPVLDHGRIKPLDTYARIELMMMNRRQEFYDARPEKESQKQPAIRWFLNLLGSGLIDSMSIQTLSPDQVRWLGLDEKRPGMVYDAAEITEAASKKQKAILELVDRKQSGKDLSPLEEQVFVTVNQALQTKNKLGKLQDDLGGLRNPDMQKVFRIDHESLLAMLKLERREGLRYSVNEITATDGFRVFFQKAMKTKDRPREKRDALEERILELLKVMSTHRALQSLQAVTLVPSEDFQPDGWKTLGQALADGDDRDNPAAKHLKNMVMAYVQNDPSTFNAELTQYSKLVQEKLPSKASKARTEAWFNQFAPFYICAVLYVLIGVLAILSWTPVSPRELWLSALLLLGLTILLHTAALLTRMWIQERPPVVNLYSSAIFIGWGCALVCLFVELIYRNAIPTAAAAVLGFMTMVIAHYLGGSGDTMEVLQAVLDTNFWLATHVTTVTLGYTATFVAGFIAILFLWWMLTSTVLAFFRNRGNPEWSNGVIFTLSIFGMLAIPAGALISVLMGLYFLTTDENPLTDGSWVYFVAPAMVFIAITGILVITQYTAPRERGELLPPMLQPLEGFSLDLHLSKSFMTAIYGVTCLALLLSFVGTVLGGIWADQSWGRFWGWDPKENGAILVVIANALLLHARWGGMIKERGTVVIALAGNMVTMWSWFGTNQLGIGLHSYGFNNALIAMCTTFWLAMMVLMGLASFPLKYWKSYTATPNAPEKPIRAKELKESTARIVPAS
jgi:ABC-type transport system involved in cytochrome c biogenesis permease subunit